MANHVQRVPSEHGSADVTLTPTHTHSQGLFRRISDAFALNGNQEKGDACTPRVAPDTNTFNVTRTTGGGAPLERAGTDMSPASKELGMTSVGWNPLALFKTPGSRAEELRKYFELPEGEMFLDDYNCALRKRVVLQGRMYIFDHYVCFSSFVFGVARKVVIPLSEVIAVRKKTHLRFPNSIKLEGIDNQGNPYNYFFTSYLSRDDAFNLIETCWNQTGRSQCNESGLHECNQNAIAHGNAPSALGDYTDARTPDNMVGGTGPASRTAHQDVDDDDDQSENECSSEQVWGLITEGEVPAVNRDSKLVIQAVMEGTSKGFFDVLLADNSHFLEDFLEGQGNRRINLASWKRDTQLGHVRDVQFISPIRGAFSNWGVPQTQCFQSHRFRQFKGHHLVFETSQTMTDIPYGDCFTVDVRWDIFPLNNNAESGIDERGPSSPFAPADISIQTERSYEPPPQLQVNIHVRVPFTRSCLFKRVIEGGAVKQIKEQYTLLVAEVREALSQLEYDRAPVQLGSPANPSIMHRLSVPLGHGGASMHHNQFRDGYQQPLDANSAMHLQRLASNSLRVTGGIPQVPSMVGLNAPSEGHLTPRQLKGFYNREGSAMGANVRAKFRDATTRVLLSFKHLGSAVSGGAVERPGQSAMFFISFLILILQLYILASTWRAAHHMAVHSRPASTHPAQDTAVAATSTISSAMFSGDFDSLREASRAMWAQRASLLQSELAFIHTYMEGVTEQLKLAMSQGQLEQ